MGMVKDGRVVFANEADRQRLIAGAKEVQGKKKKK